MVSNEVGRGTHQPAGPDQQGWQKKFHVMNSWGSFTLGTLCSALFACQPMLLFNDNARYSTKFHNQDYTVTIITYVWQGILETSRSHSDLSLQTHLPRTLLRFTIHHYHHPDLYQKSLDHVVKMVVKRKQAILRNLATG